MRLPSVSCELLIGDRKRLDEKMLQSIPFKDMEGFDFWFDPKPEKPFPFGKSLDEALQDTVLILHTSGSSGKPLKAVPVKHATYAVVDSMQELPNVNGRKTRPQVLYEPGTRLFSTFPAFHVSYSWRSRTP